MLSVAPVNGPATYSAFLISNFELLFLIFCQKSGAEKETNRVVIFSKRNYIEFNIV